MRRYCNRKLQNLQGYVIIVTGGLDDQSLCDRIPGGSEVLYRRRKGIGRDTKAINCTDNSEPATVQNVAIV